MPRSTLLIAATVIAGSSAALLPVGAAAHQFDVATTITIRASFRGQVAAAKPRCKRNRVVVVKKIVDGPNKVIGRTDTGESGNWAISRPRANGRFYALVKPKFGGSYGHNHICRRDKSPLVRR